MRRAILIGTLAVALALPLSAATVGESAPEVNAIEWLNTGGRDMSLADLRGEIVVVEFWATWCGPCRTSIPHLNELYGELSIEGVEFLSLTNETRDEADIEGFMEELDMSYPVGIGSSSSWDYNVTGIPHAFIVDRDGTIVWAGHPMGGLDQALYAALDGTLEVVNWEDIKADRASIGAASIGSLESSDSSISGRYVDAFELSVSRGDSLDISVTGDFDTTLRVVGPDGEDLSNDDAPGHFGVGGTDSGLTADFNRSGTARVYVSSYSMNDTGNYELFIAEAGQGRPGLDELAAEEIQAGRTITGSIRSDGPTHGGNAAAVYTIEVAAGDVLEISVTSQEIDTTLFVEGPSRVSEYSDDAAYEHWDEYFDLPGETDSGLVFNADESGTVYIVIRDYYGSTGGAFDLVVKRR